MNIRTIIVPKNVQYLADVKEIKEEFGNDLPHNAVINKSLTGCGGTYTVLMNNEMYIIAVPTINLIENKISQEQYKHVLGVTGSTDYVEIMEYVLEKREDSRLKIMVTYDSVPRLKEILDKTSKPSKEWRLVVDEYHKLITYLNEFKPLVSIKLIDKAEGFKSVSYLTATPTDYKYLPEPMKKLDIVEFKWEDTHKPSIKVSYSEVNIQEQVMKLILDRLDNSNEEIYVFYNSKYAVKSIVQKLMKCKPNLKLNEFNLIFANNNKNIKFFKKYLGSHFKLGVAPNGENNKRINFISSMAHDGLDFRPNDNCYLDGSYPTSIIVSDPKSKSMRYDISVDIVQILGRFRAHNKTDRFVKNDIYYVWNTQDEDFYMSEEEYLSILKQKKVEQEKGLLEIENNNLTTKDTYTLAARMNKLEHVIIDEQDESDEPILLPHPYGIEAQMSMFNAYHSETLIRTNLDEDGEVKEDSTVLSSISKISKEHSNYHIPILKAEYTKLLGRNPSVVKLVLEYESLLINLGLADKSEEVSILEKIETFKSENSEFGSWIDSGLTVKQINSLKTRDKINKASVQLKTIKDTKSSSDLPFKIGVVYTNEEILKELQNYYDNLNVTIKPKATHLENWYTICKSPKKIDGKSVCAYKIVSDIPTPKEDNKTKVKTE